MKTLYYMMVLTCKFFSLLSPPTSQFLSLLLIPPPSISLLLLYPLLLLSNQLLHSLLFPLFLFYSPSDSFIFFSKSSFFWRHFECLKGNVSMCWNIFKLWISSLRSVLLNWSLQSLSICFMGKEVCAYVCDGYVPISVRFCPENRYCSAVTVGDRPNQSQSVFDLCNWKSLQIHRLSSDCECSHQWTNFSIPDLICMCEVICGNIAEQVNMFHYLMKRFRDRQSQPTSSMLSWFRIRWRSVPNQFFTQQFCGIVVNIGGKV